MSKEILVSISCITYNHEHYIRECLDGFMMQKTDFKFEVLINDDASTDSTTSIIREYELNYPEIIKPIYQSENQYSKKNGSINANFNFPRARGKYIALCEGDDYWIDPLKLQKQVDYMERNPEYAMTFHNTSLLQDDRLNLHTAFLKVVDKDYSQKELFVNWIVATASMIFKKEVIQQTTYKSILKEKNLMFGDNLLVMSSFLSGKVRGMEDIMAVYRKHNEGVSYNVDRTLVHKLNKQNILFGKYFPVLKETIPTLIANRYYTHLKIAMKAGKLSDFIYYLRRLIKVKTVKSY